MSTIKYTVVHKVATISLNRPKQLNAFNTQLRTDLLAAIKQAIADSDVRIVMLTGEGRAFSSGADIADGFDQYPTIEDQLVLEYKPIFEAIDRSHKLFIAAINGACAGIGSGLALACDLAVMASDAYLYQAFAAIGLVPDGGASYQLVRALGYKRALAAVVECQELDAKTCLEYGLVNKVVAAELLLPTATLWAQRLAEGSPLAQRYSKEVLKTAETSDLFQSFHAEAKLQNVCVESQDHKRAAEAFLNKQSVKFEGY